MSFYLCLVRNHSSVWFVFELLTTYVFSPSRTSKPILVAIRPTAKLTSRLMVGFPAWDFLSVFFYSDHIALTRTVFESEELWGENTVSGITQKRRFPSFLRLVQATLMLMVRSTNPKWFCSEKCRQKEAEEKRVFVFFVFCFLYVFLSFCFDHCS